MSFLLHTDSLYLSMEVTTTHYLMPIWQQLAKLQTNACQHRSTIPTLLEVSTLDNHLPREVPTMRRNIHPLVRWVLQHKSFMQSLLHIQSTTHQEVCLLQWLQLHPLRERVAPQDSLPPLLQELQCLPPTLFQASLTLTRRLL